MGASSARITVDPIVGLHVLGLAVASLALFFIGLGICMHALRERRGRCCRGGRAQAESAKKVTATGVGFGLSLHKRRLLGEFAAAFQDGSAKAWVSISTNTRPSTPTWR